MEHEWDPMEMRAADLIGNDEGAKERRRLFLEAEAYSPRKTVKEGLLVETLTEVGRRYLYDRLQAIKRGRWGVWYINHRTKMFGIRPYPNKSCAYEVELERIANEGPMHWFIDLALKTWAKGHRDDLIEAFDDLFRAETWRGYVKYENKGNGRWARLGKELAAARQIPKDSE